MEILILWFIIYQSYRAFQGTRGSRIMLGLIFSLLLVSLFSLVLQLEVMSFLLNKTAYAIVIVGVILFQPELRTALARIGNSRLLLKLTGNDNRGLEFIEVLVSAVGQLSAKRYGALIAIQRKNDLDEQHETGVPMDSEFSPELALTIFHPKTALHDGGMILSVSRIATSGCVFPVSQREMSDRTLGLRHRAAIGLTEETDAVAIVVSEETGRVSVAIDGELIRTKDSDEVMRLLEDIFINNPDQTHEDEELAGEDRSTSASSRNLVSD